MKSIMVFGGSGGTGKEVIKQLLAKGYSVTALFRNPDAFEIRHADLTIVKGDVLQPSTFAGKLEGQDGVVSCLGSRGRSPTTLYSVGMTNIIKAMKEHGVDRILCLSALGVSLPPKGSLLMRFAVKNLLQKILKYPYADMLKMEGIISASAVAWTIIRPPWLRNGTRTGKYRIAIQSHIDRPFKISRADLADFIVNHLQDEATYRTFAEVSY